MISEMNPIVRLEILKEYMSKWVDEYPYITKKFNDYIHARHAHRIPGTKEFYKHFATHCFYCNCKLVSSSTNYNHPQRSSIDHYLPVSKGKTERFVICCAGCNTKKGNTSPNVLVSKMTKANIAGKEMWGFHGKKLKYIVDQIQRITNDMLYNMGPKVYYIKR